MTRNEAPDDKVGYRKPPKASQFKAGQSGNPRGRPPVRRIERAFTRQQMRRDIIELMESTLTVRTAKGIKKETAVLALLRSALNRAISGDGVSFRFLLRHYMAAISSHEDQLRGQFPHVLLRDGEREHGTKFVSDKVDADLNWLRKWTRNP